MKRLIGALFTIVVLLAGCAVEPHLPMLDVGNGEYYYVTVDPNVPGWFFNSGYSLRSTQSSRVVYTFQSRPLEVRLEDYDKDGIRDLVYILQDPKVRGVSLSNGYSLKVARGRTDGTFAEAQVIATMSSID